MIIAVQLQITIVSINTPSAWTSPTFTGSLSSAAAAAHGAEPEPASLENRPRFDSVHENRAKTARCDLAESECLLKILLKTPGTLPRCVAMMNRVITK